MVFGAFVMFRVNHGFHINHKRVQRIMHDLKLFGKRPKEKYHSYKGEVGARAGNIIQRNFKWTGHNAEMDNGCNTVSFLMGKMLPFPYPGYEYERNHFLPDLSMIPNLNQIKGC